MNNMKNYLQTVDTLTAISLALAMALTNPEVDMDACKEFAHCAMEVHNQLEDLGASLSREVYELSKKEGR